MAKRICSVDGCSEPSRSLGMCGRHYERVYRNGNLELRKTGPPKRWCTVADCTRPAHGDGLCSMHWKRVAKHGDPLLGARRMRTPARLPPTPRVGTAMHWLCMLVSSGPWQEGCIEWPANRLTQGYGRVFYNGRKRMATQVILELAGHPQPSSAYRALHSCDNPPCVNPAHLRWGTQRENVAEMYGKARRQSTAHQGCHPAGA